MIQTLFNNSHVDFPTATMVFRIDMTMLFTKNRWKTIAKSNKGPWRLLLSRQVLSKIK